MKPVELILGTLGAALAVVAGWILVTLIFCL
jgi:hypothetical protein